ncbi:MAG: LysM peptidoglycan-binding domain-containing protein [Chloroflexi bacterium]|nr:LysM peptidoglycan-binding domain-containing protein [Chloroflexota bacterium]
MKRLIFTLAILISSCAPRSTPSPLTTVTPPTRAAPSPSFGATPLPTRVRWNFGDVLPYTVQPGDTLVAIAARFNTPSDAIQQLNPEIKFANLTTLEPKIQLKIPANYAPFNGTPFWIIPDSEFINSPGVKDFSTKKFVLEQKGFLTSYDDYADQKMRPTWEVIDRVAQNYSINPRLLIALVEYRSGAITQTNIADFAYPLGYRQPIYGGLYKQLLWAAEQMSRGYYGWKSGKIVEVTFSDGRIQRLDFWQNAGTAALHSLFAELMTQEEFNRAVSPDGFSATYKKLFGDPFQYEASLMPSNLRQPDLLLPFKKDSIWSYTGAPHAVWGDDTPWAAVDFAPPAVGTGCGFSNDWATALADGVIVRSDESAVMLDLDNDGDERSGWVILYFHLRSDEMASVGEKLKAGDHIGHPSCEGGRATGTHVHIARKYNGEWIAADSIIPFVMSGWRTRSSGGEYFGSLTFDFPALKIEACECVSQGNQVKH